MIWLKYRELGPPGGHRSYTGSMSHARLNSNAMSILYNFSVGNIMWLHALYVSRTLSINFKETFFVDKTLLFLTGDNSFLQSRLPF